MVLRELIEVIDSDTLINVQENYNEVFDGTPLDAIEELRVNQLTKPLKAVWYSKVYNRLMIEI